MSYYYNFYCGYEKDGKIFPLGPYDCEGKLHDIIYYSHSYSMICDLHKLFNNVTESQISDELRKEFEYTDYNGEKVCKVKYLYLSEMPSTNFIKSGYYLIDDVKAAEEDEEYPLWNLMPRFSPLIYSAKLLNEIKFGPSECKTDEDGEEYKEPDASDMMFYAFPDYNCNEYFSFVINLYFDSLDSIAYKFNGEPGVKLVVLETEG